MDQQRNKPQYDLIYEVNRIKPWYRDVHITWYQDGTICEYSDRISPFLYFLAIFTFGLILLFGFGTVNRLDKFIEAIKEARKLLGDAEVMKILTSHGVDVIPLNRPVLPLPPLLPVVPIPPLVQ